MTKKKYRTGEQIIKYGEICQNYFILSKGTCEITLYTSGTNADDANLNDKIALVKTLKADLKAQPPLPMVDFGEISLYYNDETRHSTVIAQTDCEVWVLPPLFMILSGTICSNITEEHETRRTIQLAILNKVDLFK